MSIVYDFAAIRQALEHKPADNAVRRQWRMCRECFSSLGELSAPTVVTCKRCGETNYVDE